MAASSSSLQRERIVSEITRLGHAGLDSLDLLRRVTSTLRPLIPFDAICAATTDPVSNLITDAATEREHGGDGSADRIAANYFDRVYFEHDLGVTLSMLRQKRRVALLSHATGKAFQQSGRFRLHLEPRGLGPEAYVTFVDRGLWGELHMTRELGSPDFSPREAALLTRIAPHVGAGLKTAALRSRGAVLSHQDADEVPGVLVLNAAGHVVTATANVEAFLLDLGAERGQWRDGRYLPVAVQVVLRALHRVLMPATAGDGDQLPRLRVRARSGRWLTLDASLTEPSDGQSGARVVVVGPAQSEEIAWLTLAAYDLSPREEEVVRLVLRGLATKHISDQLCIAEHTVQRHLSNIFEKVGVRSRRDLVKRLFVEQVLPSLN